MNNVYYVGSGELTFDIIERIINEKSETGACSRSKAAYSEMSRLSGSEDCCFQHPSLRYNYRFRFVVQ